VGWVAWRRGSLVPRRVISLVVMGAVVVASGALVGPLLAQHPRVVLRDALVPPFDPQDHPSPLSGFRQFVKDWDETDLMTVRGLPAGAPVRLATLDAFDGVVWNVAGAEAAQGSGEFRRVGQTIATSVRGEQATVDFEVLDLPLVWLPTVGYAERFTFDGPEAVDLTDDLRYNDATGTAVLTSRVPAGTRWTADVVVPAVPDDAEIGAATAGAVSLPEPRDVPDAVSLFAGQIAGSATSPMFIARSLEAGLADRGWFSHGLTGSGDYPSLSGHGADRLTTLLGGDLMVGDGEQYASAMALMAREMGLPARVASPDIAPPMLRPSTCAPRRRRSSAAANTSARPTAISRRVANGGAARCRSRAWSRTSSQPPATRVAPSPADRRRRRRRRFAAAMMSSGARTTTNGTVAAAAITAVVRHVSSPRAS